MDFSEETLILSAFEYAEQFPDDLQELTTEARKAKARKGSRIFFIRQILKMLDGFFSFVRKRFSGINFIYFSISSATFMAPAGGHGYANKGNGYKKQKKLFHE
jgi:hypothetical protein